VHDRTRVARQPDLGASVQLGEIDGRVEVHLGQ
jgi:hypothetical protein